MKKFRQLMMIGTPVLLIFMSIQLITASQNFGDNSVGILQYSKNFVSTRSLLHDPIIILGDENFTAENGVISGSGTVDDPYIIANWVIKANTSEPYGNKTVGILIANTTKYFIIRNVTVFGGNWGVYLNNVTNFVIEGGKFYNITNYTVVVMGKNGVIQGNEAWDSDSFLQAEGVNIIIRDNYIHDMKIKSGSSSVGIRITASNVSIVGNTIERLKGFGKKSSIDGILVYASGDYSLGENLRRIRILNNKISNITNSTLGGGIVLYSAKKANVSGVLVKGNVLREIEENGIELDAHGNESKMSNISVGGNVVSNVTFCSIFVYDIHNNITISNNMLVNSRYHGILIENSSNVYLLDNYVHRNHGVGVLVTDSTLVSILRDNISDTGDDGIYLYNSSKVRIEHSEISTAWNGIELLYSTNAIIRGNKIHSNRNMGVSLRDFSYGNLIEGNYIYSNRDDGVSLGSTNNTVLDNKIYNNAGYAITLEDSNRNKIIENELWNNSMGISLWNSTWTFITRNRVHNNDFVGIFGGYSSKARIISNIIFNNNGPGIDVWDDSYLTIINSTVFGNGEEGIGFYNGGCGIVKNSAVFNNTLRGIYITNSSNVIIENSNISGNNGYGLELYHSNNVSVLRSLFKGNYESGIRIYGSSNIRVNFSWIIHNNIKHQDFGGIWLESSPGSEIIHSTFKNNRIGLILFSSGGNEIRNNEFFGDGVFVWRVSNDTLSNNTVNGKPLLYYEDVRNMVIDSVDAGQLIFINPANVTVMGLNISNVPVGVELIGGYNNSISDSYFRNTWDTIIIVHTYGVLVRGNTLVGKSGISLMSVKNSKISNNYIYSVNCAIFLEDGSAHNVIINNTLVSSKGYVLIFTNHSNDNEVYLNEIHGAVYLQNSTEIWDSPTPIEYFYNNGTFIGYLGNYWSDYSGMDANGDGIGDSPYVINPTNLDEHPLMTIPSKYSSAKLGSAQITGIPHITATTTSMISSCPLNGSMKMTMTAKSQLNANSQSNISASTNSQGNTKNKGICGPSSFLLLAILVLLRRIGA